MKRGKGREAARGGTLGQRGFALAGALIFLIVVTVLGSGIYFTTRRDIVHSGRDLSRMRAEFAAESAVQWALMEVSRYDGGRRPYSRATHDRDGMTPLHPDPGRDADHMGSFKGLDPRKLSRYPSATIRRGQDGWMVVTTDRKEASFSGYPTETLAFKVWYPDQATIRVSGRGTVAGVSATLEVKGRLDPALVPL